MISCLKKWREVVYAHTFPTKNQTTNTAFPRQPLSNLIGNFFHSLFPPSPPPGHLAPMKPLLSFLFPYKLNPGKLALDR